MVLAALAARLVVLLQLADHPLLQPSGRLDSAVLLDLGQQIAAGDVALVGATAGEPFFLAPLYAYFLGLVFALSGGSLLAAKGVQALLGAGAVALLFGASRPWIGPRAALLAAILLAACGPIVFHETLLLQASLDPFLIALALTLVSRALSRERVRDWLLAGVAVGVFALNRPNALLWGLALAAALPTASPSRGGLIRGAAVALGLTLAVAPASMRNLAVSGEPVLLTSHGGLNLYIGNNPEADGTYHQVAGITPDIGGQIHDARRLAEEAQGRALAIREVDAHFRGLAWSWAVAHPVDAAGLFLRKLAYVFSAREITLNYSYAYFSQDEPTLLRWLVVGPWLLVPLGLFGFGARIREALRDAEPEVMRRKGFALWALVVPAYAISVALFFVSSRYRLPLLVPLAAGAGFALVYLWEKAREGDLPRLGVSAVALAPLLALTFWPHGLDDGRGYARGDRIVWLIGAGRVDEARILLRRTEPTHPEAPVLLFRVGRALQAAGRSSEAIPVLERSLARAQGRPEVRYTLGQCLLETGRAEEAVPHLRSAFEAGVRRDLAGFDLARALAATGGTEEAARVLEELLPLALDAESRGTVVRLALQLGEPDLALRHLERAVAEAPEEARPHELRGLVLAGIGRGAEARRAFEEAARLDPGRASVHLNLAALDAQEGRFAEARAAARRALELQPGYPRALALLEQLPP